MSNPIKQYRDPELTLISLRDTLATNHFSEATWWTYSVGLNFFLLRLTVIDRSSSEDDLIIGLSLCSFLSGNTRWADPNLEIELSVSGKDVSAYNNWRLSDPSMGFEARGQQLFWYFVKDVPHGWIAPGTL